MQIREKTLEFSAVLPAPSPYLLKAITTTIIIINVNFIILIKF